MKKIFLIMVIPMMLILTGMSFALTNDEYKIIQETANEQLMNTPDNWYEIPAEDVLKRIQSGKNDFVIVDVRMPKEQFYDKGHLPGAIYIGFKEIFKPENLAKLPKDKDIILACWTGNQHNKVIMILRMLGYKAYNLRFGFMSWKTTPATDLMLKVIEGSILNNYPVEK